MKHFKGKVALITGAAGGIGFAFAEKCHQEGMHLVLTDIRGEALAETERHFQQKGARVISRQTDVGRAGEMQALADAAFNEFSAVHLLINNAGVGVPRYLWELTLKDWDWVLKTNLYGPIHAMRAFLPRMMETGEAGHVVNTASTEAFLPGTGPGGGAYGVSKTGLVHLSETLRFELKSVDCPIGVSVLCPAVVPTGIFDCEKHRPAIYEEAGGARPASGKAAYSQAVYADTRRETGITSPRQVAEITFAGIRRDDLYIFCPAHDRIRDSVEDRFDSVLDGFERCRDIASS